MFNRQFHSSTSTNRQINISRNRENHRNSTHNME